MNENKCGAFVHTPRTAETQTGAIIVTIGCDCQASKKTSAITTLPANQIDYVCPLKLAIAHSDHELKQVWRDETHAVYKHFGNHGQFIGFEAILIKVAPARRIFGKDYPAREVYPLNEDFGRYALSVAAQYDLQYAIKKAKTLKLFRRGDRQKTNSGAVGDRLDRKPN